MRLTDISVRALKPPESGQRTYSDDLIPGFGVRVSQGGTKTFVLVHGKRRARTTLGRFPVISLTEARQAAKRILAERTLGKHQPRTVAFATALSEYLAYVEHENKASTHLGYKRLLEKHLLPAFRNERLADVRLDDIMRRVEALSDRPALALNLYTSTRAFLRWAVKRQYLDRNPLADAEPPSKSPSRDRVLKPEELRAVYNASLIRPHPFGPISSLLILTGQRRGEIAQLRGEWVNRAERLITLPSEVTKNGREHTFPYGERAAGIIELLPEKGHFFPASVSVVNGKPTTVFNGWHKAKIALDKGLTVQPYTLHDLRRSYATGLASLGVSIHVIERLLNHITGEISGIVATYNRYSYLQEMRTAVALWEAHLDSLLASS